MDLSEILDDRIICIDMPSENKDEAITFLSEKLKDAGYIDDVQSFKKDIYYRESVGITGIGNYIAIPHGKSDSVKNVGVAIGKLRHEIKWETLDGKGVKVVFLFAVGKGKKSDNTHLMLLSQVASKLGDDSKVVQLLKARTVEDIKKVFV